MSSSFHEERTMPDSGRLEGIGIPDLFWALCRQSKTGVLKVHRGPIQRTVFIVNGQVTFAASTNPNDRLGETLLREGKISLAQLETALSEQRGSQRLGALMLGAGVLEADDLVATVQGQVRTILLDLLTWNRGHYRFEEGPVPDEEITLGGSTAQHLLDGLRRIRSCRAVNRGVGGSQTVYRLSDDWGKRIEELQLTEGADLLIERLAKGSASVDALCRGVCMSNFEICQTVWALRLLGVVQSCLWDDRGDEIDRNRGRLEQTGFAELLIEMESERATGVLYVSQGEVERSFHFGAGRCVFATSNSPDESLVSYLFQRGIISLSDREEMDRRMLSNKRVGTILRELGAIDQPDLQNMVRSQVGEVIYGTIGWDQGEFVFCQGPLPGAEDITINSSAGAIVAEGIRRVSSWTRLVQGCGGIDNPLCLTPNYLQVLDDMGAGVAEWDVVSAMKSIQTPRRVCLISELSDFRVCQILWTLRLLGALEDSPVEVEESGLPMDLEAQVEREEIPAADAEESASADTASDERRTAAAVDESPPANDVDPELVNAELRALVPEAEQRPEPEARPDVNWVTLDLPEDTESLSTASPSAPTAGEVTARPVQQPEAEIEDSAGWDAPDGTDDVIHRFNAMHRVVFRAVRTEIGAGAANFVRSCCVNAAKNLTDPIEGVELHADGSWDPAGLKQVIVNKRIEDPWQLFQAVLDLEFVTLLPHLGEEQAEELKRKIWEIQNQPPG